MVCTDEIVCQRLYGEICGKDLKGKGLERRLHYKQLQKGFLEFEPFGQGVFLQGLLYQDPAYGDQPDRNT